MEAGLASSEEDEIQFRVTFSAGLGFEGSHFSTEGINTSGVLVPVDEYQHRLEVEVFQFTPEVSIPFSEETSIEIGLPLRRISRVASIDALAGTSSSDQEDMQRHVDLHHPTENLEGVGDLSLWMRSRDSEQHWSWGLTLPTGGTEEAPYVLGNGPPPQAHEHVQFGTGTVVPRLQFFRGEEDWISLGTLSLPLYSNHHGFTAPPELSLYSALRGPIAENWTWSAGLSARLQGFGDWDGTRDINTGYGALVADGGLLWNGSAGRLILGVTMPLAQEVWEETGDTFELGPSLAVSFSP